MCTAEFYNIGTRLMKIERVTSIIYKLACAYSEDSNQSAHPHSLIRVLVFRLKKRWTLATHRTHNESSDQSAQMRRLIRDCIERALLCCFRWTPAQIRFVRSIICVFFVVTYLYLTLIPKMCEDGILKMDL